MAVSLTFSSTQLHLSRCLHSTSVAKIHRIYNGCCRALVLFHLSGEMFTLWQAKIVKGPQLWIWKWCPNGHVFFLFFFFSSFPHEHSAYFLVGLLMPWWAGSVSWSSPCWRWIHCFFPFVFVQVFGDYYHFRHHAVEKRALSGHRGMHIRLQKEPQVRLLSALTVLIAATKGQKTDWITRNVCVYHKRKECRRQWRLVKPWIFCSPHQSFHLSLWPDPRRRVAVNMQNISSQTKQQLGVSLCLASLFLLSHIIYTWVLTRVEN